MIAQLSKREQETILICVEGLPPDRYWDQCDTDDRQQHWEDCRLGFGRLAIALKAYFSGNTALMDLIPIELHEPFILWRDRYLALYIMLFDGWRHIQEAAIENQVSIPDNPVEMLLHLITDQSDEIFMKAFPEQVTGNAYSEFSPRKEYDLRREHSHVIRLLEGGDQLSESDSKRVEKHRKELQKRNPWIQFSVRECFCVWACTQAAEHDRNMKKRVKAFHQADLECESDLYQAIHPRNKPRGFAFNKGKMLHSAPGGVYR